MKTETQQALLKAIGIDVWQLREQKNQPVRSHEQEWAALEKAAAICTACPLHQSRTKVVFGSGSHHARLFIVGEAPGFHEDQQGKPFVGRAGQLLTNMLAAIGLSRDEVYIANILKCRPPDNRDPTPDEALHCRGFLEKQIALVNPALILTLGRIATRYLLGREDSLSRLRSTIHAYKEIPVIVSYHPAYLLRNPVDKRKSYRDLQLVQQHLS